MKDKYLASVSKEFRYYKQLGERTFEQLEDDQLFFQPHVEGNSIAILVNHIAGNMFSRWTDFLTSDGEKKWRNRDQEFEKVLTNRKDLLTTWDEGWSCLFEALESCKSVELDQIVFIRNIGHTLTEAINRQLAHYSYHIGQIVFMGKLLKQDQWLSLSIPKNKSVSYNIEKFDKEKHRGHFTDEL